MNNNIAIIILCTNLYYKLGIRLIENFSYFYKGDKLINIYLFTDKEPIYKINNNKLKIRYIYTVHNNWVEGVGSKFSSIYNIINEYTNIDNNKYIYYFDADTNINKDFTTDWFIGDLVGGEHFANDNTMLNNKLYDRNNLSKAYIPYNTPLLQIYYLGAFFGGKIDKIKKLCIKLIENQKYDKEKINYEPVWNDESYLNNYFHYNKPSKIILFKDFEFVTSDKGDIENIRSGVDEQTQSVTIEEDIDEQTQSVTIEEDIDEQTQSVTIEEDIKIENNCGKLDVSSKKNNNNYLIIILIILIILLLFIFLLIFTNYHI